jgi:hypothetical protein
MIWLQLFFRTKSDLWQIRANKSEAEIKPGHRSYALQQKAMWEKCSEHSRVAFDNLPTDIQ